jgi:hypothetical protein
MPNEMDIAVASLLRGSRTRFIDKLTVDQCEEVAAALFEDIAAARNRKGQVATVGKGYAIWRR